MQYNYNYGEFLQPCIFTRPCNVLTPIAIYPFMQSSHLMILYPVIWKCNNIPTYFRKVCIWYFISRRKCWLVKCSTKRKTSIICKYVFEANTKTLSIIDTQGCNTTT